MGKGWYSDAFSSDMSKADTSNITSNSGNAIKNLGDAFTNIGKVAEDSELNKKKNKLLDNQIQEQEQKTTDSKYLSSLNILPLL